jgi:hypothetical protein
MNLNPLNLQIGETVLADGKHEVVIQHFTPQFLFATIFDLHDSSKRTWTILTSRLTRI